MLTVGAKANDDKFLARIVFVCAGTVTILIECVIFVDIIIDCVVCIYEGSSIDSNTGASTDPVGELASSFNGSGASVTLNTVDTAILVALSVLVLSAGEQKMHSVGCHVLHLQAF